MWENLAGNMLKYIAEAPDKGIRYMIKGAAGAGKTALLQERCLYLAQKPETAGPSVLVLLADNAQLGCWNSALSEKISGKIRCCTFSAFIREELTVYYPLATAGCDEIVQKDIRPVFLPAEASLHLISKVIQARREKDGLFAALTYSNERIASILANNLKSAALEGIDAGEIGSRLYHALDRKDAEKERILKDMDEIGLAYRKRCLELGVLDSGMAVEIYRKYLLQDNDYRQSLFKRYRHLIIDDFQETSYAMLELTDLFLGGCGTAFLAYDPEFGSAELLRGNGKLIESRIQKACQVVELEKAGRSAFAQALYSAVIHGEVKDTDCRSPIERFPAVELRSEMLEQLAYKVCSLVKEDGYKPSDIVILSTYADIVSDLVIRNILSENGISLTNTGAGSYAADTSLCSGLLVFAQLCHPEFRLFPDRGAVKRLVELLFKFDPVRSSKIARKTCGAFPFPRLPDLVEIMPGDTAAGHIKEKYEYVRNWVDQYKRQEKPMQVGTFLQLSLLEIFLDGADPGEEILKARQLVDRAERFCSASAKFGRNTGRDFIEMAGNVLKAGEGLFQPGEALNEGCVVLTTPEAHILSPIDNKVMIISGLSSRHWSRGMARELSNPHVLGASWEKGMKYTQETEEGNSRKYMASILRAVLEKGTGRMIAFESQLSENGFENDGVLPGILDKI